MEVAFVHVSKRYGEVPALENASAVVPSGRRVALIGPNGSGKSTLTRAILGLISFEGEVRLDGRSPTSDRLELARRFAYVPQAAPQLSAGVGDVVRLVSRLRGWPPRWIEDVARRLGLDLAAVAGRRVRDLSSGMKQKLAIALALAGPADLFVLDEPTSSLDPAARREFFSLFSEAAARATLILCSHRIEEIEHLVDHVLYLDGGRLTFDGPAARFLDERAMSLIELSAHDACGERLADLGFAQTSSVRWSKTVPRREKLALTKTLLSELDGQVVDLSARDFETVARPAGEEAP